MTTAAISSNVHGAPQGARPKPQLATSAKTPSAPAPAQSSAAVAGAVVSASAAALKEVTETSAQTVKEATGGDRQAQRLLAKEAAAHGGGTPGGAQPVTGKGGRLSVKA
jgi:hypothetical protein